MSDTFVLHSPYKPTGDQPAAIAKLVDSINSGKREQTLLGVTGSGKTFTMANVIERVQKPTLILSHNKTLAAQLYSEFKSFFPDNAVHYFVPSHASFEIGYKLAMDAMELEPLFLLGMRLGEGSGCPLAFQVLDAACAIINDMATFEQAGINDDYLEEIREGDKFTVEGAV